MSLLETIRSRVLVTSILNGSSGGQQPFWHTYASKVAILALFYGAFFAIKRKLGSCDTTAAAAGSFSSTREMSGNSDACPICLDTPRHGVLTGCGHKICARCLRSYCKFYSGEKNASDRPPPCPLCRTPLVSITVTYDQSTSVSDDGCSTNESLDPELAGWIGEFNARDFASCNDGGGGGGYLANVLGPLYSCAMACCKLALAVIVFLATVGLQNVSIGTGDATRSCLVIGLGMSLLGWIWYRCHGQRDSQDVEND